MANGPGRSYFVKPAQIVMSGDALAAQSYAEEAKGARDAAQAAQAAAETAETNAETAQTASETSATNSANSATAAAGSATASANSATASAGSAADANTSKLAAQAAEAAAEALLDNFNDIYLGPHATPPTVDNDGDPLQVGMMYYDSTNLAMKVWNGTMWTDFTGVSTMPATAITVTPTGNISSTNVQAALAELDTEKATTGAVALKADKTYVDAQDAALQTAINTKAATTYVDTQDAALQTAINTKAATTYVDAEVAAVQADADAAAAAAAAAQTTANNAVKKSGDTMTGPLSLPADPTANLQAATKQYVDVGDAATTANANNRVLKAGDTMTGSLVVRYNVPEIAFWDNAAGVDLRRSRLISSGGATYMQSLTDAGALRAQGFAFSHDSGIFSFSLRPLFNGAVPWDYTNFPMDIVTVPPTPGDAPVWNGTKFVPGLSGGAVVSDTPPTFKPGALWWESDSGKMYIGYRDVNSDQWVQTNANTGVSEAPADGAVYGRKDLTWARVVYQAGDVMTGALQVGANAPFALYPNSLTGGNISAYGGVLFNGAYDSAGAYKALTAGRVASQVFDTASGVWTFNLSTADVAAGAAPNMSAVMLYSPVNGLTLNANLLTFPGTATFQVGGTGRMAINDIGGISVNRPTGLAHGVLSYGIGTSGYAGLLGYGGGGTSIYGACGMYIEAQGTWGFYTSGGGYAAGGSWNTSDGTLKDVSGDLNPAEALANVKAVRIKNYQPSSVAARGMVSGNTDAGADLVGWLAQDIEAVIPAAVRDVAIPEWDLRQRAAMKRAAVPEEGSAEAKALAAEDITVKAINLYPMLAQLWAAVQALSDKIDALEGR